VATVDFGFLPATGQRQPGFEAWFKKFARTLARLAAKDPAIDGRGTAVADAAVPLLRSRVAAAGAGGDGRSRTS
jgi:hypothetical protein